MTTGSPQLPEGSVPHLSWSPPWSPSLPDPLYGVSVFCCVLGPEQQQGRRLPCLRKGCVGTEANTHTCPAVHKSSAPPFHCPLLLEHPFPAELSPVPVQGICGVCTSGVCVC